MHSIFSAMHTRHSFRLLLLVAFSAMTIPCFLSAQSDTLRVRPDWYDSVWTGIRLVPVDGETTRSIDDVVFRRYVMTHHEDLERLRMIGGIIPFDPVFDFVQLSLETVRSIKGEKTVAKYVVALAQCLGLDPEFDIDQAEAERAFSITMGILRDLKVVDYDELYWLVTDGPDEPKMQGIVGYDSVAGTTRFFPRMFSKQMNGCLQAALDSAFNAIDSLRPFPVDPDEMVVPLDTLQAWRFRGEEKRRDRLPAHLLDSEFTWLVTPDHLAAEFSPLLLPDSPDKLRVTCEECEAYGLTVSAGERIGKSAWKIKARIEDPELFRRNVPGRFRVVPFFLVLLVQNGRMETLRTAYLTVVFDARDWE